MYVAPKGDKYQTLIHDLSQLSLTNELIRVESISKWCVQRAAYVAMNFSDSIAVSEIPTLLPVCPHGLLAERRSWFHQTFGAVPLE